VSFLSPTLVALLFEHEEDSMLGFTKGSVGACPKAQYAWQLPTNWANIEIIYIQLIL